MVAGSVVAALAATAATLVVFVDSTHEPKPATVSSTPSAAGTPFAYSPAMSGADLLRAIAAQIVDSPADHTTGRYTAIVAEQWARATHEIRPAQIHSWHNTARRYPPSAHETRVKGPAIPLSTFRLSPDLRAVWAGHQLRTEDIPDATPIAEIALSGTDDPAADLRSQLYSWSYPASDPVHLDELYTLFRNQLVPTRLRAAVLLLLAELPRWTHHQATDLAGRTGIAFEMISDQGQDRQVLLIDPHTGQLLAYERWWQTKHWLNEYTMITAVSRCAADGCAAGSPSTPPSLRSARPAPASAVRPSARTREPRWTTGVDARRRQQRRRTAGPRRPGQPPSRGSDPRPTAST